MSINESQEAADRKHSALLDAIHAAYRHGYARGHAHADLEEGFDPDTAANEYMGQLPAATLALLDGEVGREWRPIDTAPKDGTLILGWPQDGGGPVIVWWASHGEQFKDQDGWDTGECDGYGDPKPKEILAHWMPLPDAPRAARPEGEEGQPPCGICKQPMESLQAYVAHKCPGWRPEGEEVGG